MHAYEALLPAVVVVVDADMLVDPAGELEDVDELVADLAVVVVVWEVEAYGSFVSALYTRELVHPTQQPNCSTHTLHCP